VWGKTVDSPISTSEGHKLVKPKIKLKIKIGLAEEGDITIRGIITGSINFTRRSPV
jgi:hypothetical protein